MLLGVRAVLLQAGEGMRRRIRVTQPATDNRENGAQANSFVTLAADLTCDGPRVANVEADRLANSGPKGVDPRLRMRLLLPDFPLEALKTERMEYNMSNSSRRAMRIWGVSSRNERRRAVNAVSRSREKTHAA